MKIIALLFSLIVAFISIPIHAQSFGRARGTSLPTLVSSNSGSMLIYIDDGSASSHLYVGRLGSWSNYGENNLFVTSAGSPAPIIGSEYTLYLDNIDHNYWGTGVDPVGHSPCHDCQWNAPTVNAQANGLGNQLSYIATAGETRTSQMSFSGIYCGTGWGQTAEPKLSRQTSSILDDSNYCHDSYFRGYQLFRNREWVAAYDTLTHFVETCPLTSNPAASGAFTMIGTSIAHIGQDDVTRAKYLAWLESVLYLNTRDPEYFCQCVEQISGTLPLPHDTTPGAASRATNINLGVIQWLLQNTTCDTPWLWQSYLDTRESQLEQWRNDPTAYKLDTTLPPLSKWGLDTLLGKHFLYAGVRETSGPEILTSVSVAPNPAAEGTLISFGLSKEAYVKIELFDVLGTRVEIPPLESLFEAGNHAIPLSLHGLPSGTYYARLVTAYGEAQTVKIVKE